MLVALATYSFHGLGILEPGVVMREKGLSAQGFLEFGERGVETVWPIVFRGIKRRGKKVNRLNDRNSNLSPMLIRFEHQREEICASFLRTSSLGLINPSRSLPRPVRYMFSSSRILISLHTPSADVYMYHGFAIRRPSSHRIGEVSARNAEATALHPAWC